MAERVRIYWQRLDRWEKVALVAAIAFYAGIWGAGAHWGLIEDSGGPLPYFGISLAVSFVVAMLLTLFIALFVLLLSLAAELHARLFPDWRQSGD
ncbi:MAG: hypothetical protein M1274_00950 [Actinobacteria bacterium]|nr:hypothetical protein [Actinomycetota bacterium]